MPASAPIALTGATGFVGSWLLQNRPPGSEWIALSRSERVSDEDGVQWRQADLFSLPSLTRALTGAKVGIYLVHSMLPSSRLVQGSFADLDLLLADNFVRAAEEAGLEHLLYLGGLIPKGEDDLSEHLRSRREVETVLRSRSLEVTVLRSGLIYGRGGSSTRLLIQLVRRLPVMILPKWTRETTQSSDVRDVARAIDLCLHEPRFRGGTWDLASHEPMSYREMILRTAKVLGHQPRTLNFPANCIGLSRLWVALISQTTPRLVNPLLASLRHSLVAQDNLLRKTIASQAIPFEQSVRDSVDEEGRPDGYPQRSQRRKNRRRLRQARRVRSVQRMPLPAGWDALQVATCYGQWLTRSSGTVIVVDRLEDGSLIFRLRWPRLVLLELHPSELTRHLQRRRVFYIRGGLLCRNEVEPPGRFEFRLVEEGRSVMAAIHEFPPRLPWWIYQYTQALLHLLVMRAFGLHLKQLRAHPQETEESGFASSQTFRM
ncbi:MAG: NAD-dependent epimerase/dehydratase family protein [Verrucomicrobiota bacterium]